MSRMPLLETTRRRIGRLSKISRRWLIAAARGGRPSTRAVFIFGTQRSGTRVPLLVARRTAEIMPYGEGAAGFYRGVLLSDYPTLERSLDRSPFPMVMLKPICDSHRADQILDRFDQSRGLWIFRDYKDTVRSAARKWPSAAKGIELLAEGEIKAAGWWAGGLTGEDFELVRQNYCRNMTPEEAHALLWYLRNTFYFRLKLDKREDVRLIKYEDLVTDPEARFAELFRFIDVPFQERFVSAVRASAVGGRSTIKISNRIHALCSEVYDRLTTSYRSQSVIPKEAL